MARVLIVGCGCRGGELAAELIERGHAVRGTTRRAERVREIEELGAEGVVADPNRLGTLMPHLQGASVVCWLVDGGPLESLAAKLVDTHVRGFACESSGAEVARRFAETYRMPTAVIGDGKPWAGEAVRAVESIIG